MTRQSVLDKAVATAIELIDIDGQPLEEALHTVIRHGEVLTPRETIELRRRVREHQKHKA